MRLFRRQIKGQATDELQCSTPSDDIASVQPPPELTTSTSRPRLYKRLVKHIKAAQVSKGFASFVRRHVPQAAQDDVPIVSTSQAATCTPVADRTSSSSPTPTTNGTDESETDQELWWGPVPHIKEYLIRELILRLVGDQYGSQCWIFDTKQGTYNHVFIIQFRNETKICLKVPATGWTKRWTPEHAVDLRREALTLRYMHQRLGDSFPCPDLLSYDDTLDNEIAAPFILMTFLPGRSGYRAWYDFKKNSNGDWNHAELGRLRENILQSLAHHMSMLRTITFPKIGVLEFDNDDCENPHIVPEMRSSIDYGREQDPENPYPSSRERVKTFSKTRELFHDMWAQVKLDDDDECDQAREKMLSQVSFHLPRSFDARIEGGSYCDMKETFSIAHDDLDLQNILVDHDGNVTGILDWDKATIRPHFLGWATVPMWIRGDCNYGLPWPAASRTRNSPVTLQYWRCKYSMAMDKALGYDDDGLDEDEKDRLVMNYTVMSHLGAALFDGLRQATAACPNRGQLRYIADVIIQMIFPTTPLPYTYDVLGDLKPDKTFRYKVLPEEDEGHRYIGDWIGSRLSWILSNGSPEEWQWTEVVDKRIEKLTGPEIEEEITDDNESVYFEQNGVVYHKRKADAIKRADAGDDEEHAKAQPEQSRRGSDCSSASSVPSHPSSDGGSHGDSSRSSMSSAPSSPVLDVATIARFDVETAKPSPPSVLLPPGSQCPSDATSVTAELPFITVANDPPLKSSVLGPHLPLAHNPPSTLPLPSTILPAVPLPQPQTIATNPSPLPPAVPSSQPPPSYPTAIQHPPFSHVNPVQQIPHQNGALPPLYDAPTPQAEPLHRSPGCMNLVESYGAQSDTLQVRDFASDIDILFMAEIGRLD